MAKSTGLSLPKAYSIDFRELGSDDSKVWSNVCLPFPNNEILQPCLKCKKRTYNRCPKCYSFAYCSNECWKSEAKRHLTFCKITKNVELVKGKDGIPVYKLTQSVPRGDPLFVEGKFTPILPTLPPGYTDDPDQWGKSNYWLKMVCFGCHNHFFLRGAPYCCPGCGLIKCGPYCVDDYHSNNECFLLKQFQGRNLKTYAKLTIRKYIDLYLDICVLRILHSFSYGICIASVADRWKKFLMLSTTKRFKALKNNDNVDLYDGIRYMNFLTKSVDFLEFSLLYTRHNREIVRQVYKTMVAFWEEFEMPCTGILSRVLLVHKHFMVHSYCSPNVTMLHSVKICQDLKVGVSPVWDYYATTDMNLKKGTEVKLSFDFSPHRFMPLPLRVMSLRRKGLECYGEPQCTLCQDASDGNTHSGSIKCLVCQAGLYVEDGLKVKDGQENDKFPKRWSDEYVEKVNWKCRKCGDVQPFSLILKVNQNLYDHYRNLKKSSRWSVATDASKFANYYENYCLHRKNGIILLAKYDFLLASQIRHLKGCGFNSCGIPLDQYRLEKTILKYPEMPKTIRLFCYKWDRQELVHSYQRKLFSKDCLRYLRDISKFSNAVAICPELIFLRMENVLMNVITSSFQLLPLLSPDLNCKLIKAVSVALSVMKECQQLKSKQLSRGGHHSPLFYWSDEEVTAALSKFKETRKQQNATAFSFAIVVLELMGGLSLDKFMLGEGVNLLNGGITDNGLLTDSTIEDWIR